MLKQLKTIIATCMVLLMLAAGSSALAQTTTLNSTFTYQGSLSVSSAPFNGTCDFEFSLFDDQPVGTPDNQIGTTLTRSGVTVSGGVFTVSLDFGGTAFNGTDRYLAIAVVCPAGGTPVLLSPRQPITPAPYALGLYGLEVQQNNTSPNMIGGFSGNVAGTGIFGATIGGGGTATVGSPNTVNGNYATIGGGSTNTAGGAASTIAGGEGNVAGSLYSTVGGGNQNSANGQFSVVPGGFQNIASGFYSLAAGRNALAANDGAFVWNDSTGLTGTPLSSTVNNQFIARASGGFTFLTSATGATDTGAVLAAGGGDWANMSDRNVKENFVSIDPQGVLQDVVAMPITSWNYIAQGSTVRHIGPMAQDFYAAFGVGIGDRYISTVDASGVALAAIQGLYQLVQDKDTQIASLQAENDALEARLNDLDARLAALESLASPSQAGLGSPMMLVVLAAAGFGLMGWRASRKGSSL